VKKNGVTNTHVPIAVRPRKAGRGEVSTVVPAGKVVTSLVEDLGTNEIAPLESVDILLITTAIVVLLNSRSEVVVGAQPVQKTNVIGDGRSKKASGNVEGYEVTLVLPEAATVRIGDVRNKERVSVELITIVVIATATILLSRLATVGPVLVEITAELRLAGTVVTIRRIEAGVQVVDRGVAVVVSDTAGHGGIVGQALRGRRRSTTIAENGAGVLVADTESTLEEGAINALVLTATNISLEVARIASSIELGLATVDRRVIAIDPTSSASEHALTSSERVNITIAEDRLEDINVGLVNASVAVNLANTSGVEVGLSSLATITPIVVGITAESLRAIVHRAREGVVSNVLDAGRRARNGTREA